MQPAARTSLGYGIVGFLLGIFVLVWFYLWSVRSGTAEVQDPLWVVTYFAIVLVPAAILAFVGWNKTKTPSAPA